MSTSKMAIGMALATAVGLTATPAVWAATSTTTANVTATVTTRATATLKRDTNSATRGTATSIVFDRFDDQDPGVTSPNGGFMYAPYRSETNKNWHIIDILANGTSMTLTASVTGTAGTTPLSSILRAWCGGFFTPGATTPLPGTATVDDGNVATDDWQQLSTFSRTLNQPFTGTVPMNYRLSISGVSGSATPYTGNVTYTLVSN
ncbi:MAG: hypothetical protein HYT88_02900 [Candidatus Omnitrophica bacterium]|nr:hypothetical protein [Candidatus Omnitrophota bacterium]MBI3009478.1 hypothetical protein [Candidatus Omnitrophota bacterium]